MSELELVSKVEEDATQLVRQNDVCNPILIISQPLDSMDSSFFEARPESTLWRHQQKVINKAITIFNPNPENSYKNNEPVKKAGYLGWHGVGTGKTTTAMHLALQAHYKINNYVDNKGMLEAINNYKESIQTNNIRVMTYDDIIQNLRSMVETNDMNNYIPSNTTNTLFICDDAHHIMRVLRDSDIKQPIREWFYDQLLKSRCTVMLTSFPTYYSHMDFVYLMNLCSYVDSGFGPNEQQKPMLPFSERLFHKEYMIQKRFGKFWAWVAPIIGSRAMKRILFIIGMSEIIDLMGGLMTVLMEHSNLEIVGKNEAAYQKKELALKNEQNYQDAVNARKAEIQAKTDARDAITENDAAIAIKQKVVTDLEAKVKRSAYETQKLNDEKDTLEGLITLRHAIGKEGGDKWVELNTEIETLEEVARPGKDLAADLNAYNREEERFYVSKMNLEANEEAIEKQLQALADKQQELRDAQDASDTPGVDDATVTRLRGELATEKSKLTTLRTTNGTLNAELQSAEAEISRLKIKNPENADMFVADRDRGGVAEGDVFERRLSEVTRNTAMSVAAISTTTEAVDASIKSNEKHRTANKKEDSANKNDNTDTNTNHGTSHKQMSSMRDFMLACRLWGIRVGKGITRPIIYIVLAVFMVFKMFDICAKYDLAHTYKLDAKKLLTTVSEDTRDIEDSISWFSYDPIPITSRVERYNLAKQTEKAQSKSVFRKYSKMRKTSSKKVQDTECPYFRQETFQEVYVPYNDNQNWLFMDLTTGRVKPEFAEYFRPEKPTHAPKFAYNIFDSDLYNDSDVYMSRGRVIGNLALPASHKWKREGKNRSRNQGGTAKKENKGNSKSVKSGTSKSAGGGDRSRNTISTFYDFMSSMPVDPFSAVGEERRGIGSMRAVNVRNQNQTHRQSLAVAVNQPLHHEAGGGDPADMHPNYRKEVDTFLKKLGENKAKQEDYVVFPRKFLTILTHVHNQSAKYAFVYSSFKEYGLDAFADFIHECIKSKDDVLDALIPGGILSKDILSSIKICELNDSGKVIIKESNTPVDIKESNTLVDIKGSSTPVDMMQPTKDIHIILLNEHMLHRSSLNINSKAELQLHIMEPFIQPADLRLLRSRLNPADRTYTRDHMRSKDNKKGMLKIYMYVSSVKSFTGNMLDKVKRNSFDSCPFKRFKIFDQDITPDVVALRKCKEREQNFDRLCKHLTIELSQSTKFKFKPNKGERTKSIDVNSHSSEIEDVTLSTIRENIIHMRASEVNKSLRRQPNTDSDKHRDSLGGRSKRRWQNGRRTVRRRRR